MRARRKRASSGPASRKDAGSARPTRRRSRSCDFAAHRATSWSSSSRPPHRSREDLEHRLHVANLGHVLDDHLFVGQRRRARIGRAPFLFPAAAIVPDSGAPPSMTNFSMSLGRRRWATIGPLTPRSESLTAMFSRQVRSLRPGTCKARESGHPPNPPGHGDAGCNIACSLESIHPALASRFSRAGSMGTDVRRTSVRDRSYLTNTCSHHCGHHHLPSGRSERSIWPARSSCSRTTTTSTEVDRDEPSVPDHPHRVPLRRRSISRRGGSPGPVDHMCLSPVSNGQPVRQGIARERSGPPFPSAVARTLRGSTCRPGVWRRARPA